MGERSGRRGQSHNLTAVLAEQSIFCPYCGERLTVLIDPSDASNEYIEDCQVCCRPMLMSVDPTGGHVTARAEFE